MTFALAFSLVVALTLVPMLAAGRAGRPTVDDVAEQAPAPPIRARRRIDAALAAVAAGARRVAGWISSGLRVLLSPLVFVTQALNGWAEARYPAAIRWALARPGLTIGIAVGLLVSRLPSSHHVSAPNSSRRCRRGSSTSTCGWRRARPWSRPTG